MTKEERKIYDILKEVIDPELMVNIIDLGLVNKVLMDNESNLINIEMTLSSRGCPLGDVIFENVNQVILGKYPDYTVDIQLVWDPLWSPEMITEEGKKILGQ